jgi:Putative MetA-pathway of phenol degradation
MFHPCFRAPSWLFARRLADRLARIRSALTKVAAAGVLSLCSAVSALAGSVTQPGSTIGPAAGAPIPPGVYFSDWIDQGCRTSQSRLCLGDDIPVLTWSTPWTIFGARLQTDLAQIIPVWLGVQNEFFTSGIFNPFLSVQLAWDLGNGWGFSYMLGYYTAVQGTISTSSNSVNQRFALSYTANGWNLTTNNILGIVDHPLTNYPHGSPCPSFPSKGCNTDFYNNDITATKTFGKWQLGPVAFFSTDLNTPIRGYRKQSQFAVGVLVGYNLGPAILQTYLTRDVYQKNYGGYDTRLWASIAFKVW